MSDEIDEPVIALTIGPTVEIVLVHASDCDGEPCTCEPVVLSVGAKA